MVFRFPFLDDESVILSFFFRRCLSSSSLSEKPLPPLAEDVKRQMDFFSMIRFSLLPPSTRSSLLERAPLEAPEW